jgi:primase-polymerase (primpol)-like protein
VAPDLFFTRVIDIPAGLTGDRWLPWRPEGRHKVPFGRDGMPCNPHDPRAWLPFAEAWHRSRVIGDSGARMGYALDGAGLVALDWDRVVDAQTGVIAPPVQALLETLGSYAELSPSGLGLHAYLADDVPLGNRRIWGLEVLTTGFVTVTGHPVQRRPIISGGEALQQILDALPPPSMARVPGSTTTLSTPSPHLVEALIDRALPNPRFRRLWAGDWSEYPSQSEADAAFLMHLARNGGDLTSIVAALRRSGLQRPKLRRNDYVWHQALFALATAEIRLPSWRGGDLATYPEADHLRRRLDASPRGSHARARPGSALMPRGTGASLRRSWSATIRGAPTG